MTLAVKTSHKHQISWAVAILATVALAVYSTIYSLTHGIYEVFPFLYFLPIIRSCIITETRTPPSLPCLPHGS